MRFAVSNVGGGHEMSWQGQACGTNADFGERASAGGHHGPAIRGEGMQELGGAGKGNDVRDIFDLAALHVSVLGRMIGIREQFPDSCEAGASVRHGDNGIGIETMFERPGGPDAGHGGGGVNEYAVQIE